jgi:hypothetical protein
MYGLLIDCFEKFIIKMYGESFWNEVADKAGYSEAMGTGWIINECYLDTTLPNILNLVAEKLACSVEGLIEEMGYFFIDYARFGFTNHY